MCQRRGTIFSDAAKETNKTDTTTFLHMAATITHHSIKIKSCKNTL